MTAFARFVLVLLAALSLTLAGCGRKDQPEAPSGKAAQPYVYPKPDPMPGAAPAPAPATEPAKTVRK